MRSILRSFPRTQESTLDLDWVPACAGTSGISSAAMQSLSQGTADA
jgi:hypothetical protein